MLRVIISQTPCLTVFLYYPCYIVNPLSFPIIGSSDIFKSFMIVCKMHKFKIFYT